MQDLSVRRIAVLGVVALVLVVAQGCDKKKLDVAKGSCNKDHSSPIVSDGCVDYTEGTADEHKQDCRLFKGTYAATPCDRTGALAGCLVKSSTFKEVEWFYKNTTLNKTEAEARAHCCTGKCVLYSVAGDLVAR
jgi:hypothetical protein